MNQPNSILFTGPISGVHRTDAVAREVGGLNILSKSLCLSDSQFSFFVPLSTDEFRDKERGESDGDEM